MSVIQPTKEKVQIKLINTNSFNKQKALCTLMQTLTPSQHGTIIGEGGKNHFPG